MFYDNATDPFHLQRQTGFLNLSATFNIGTITNEQ